MAEAASTPPITKRTTRASALAHRHQGVFVDLTVGVGVAIGGGRPRLIGIENVIGTVFDDFIRGDGNANALTGLGGNDTLVGFGGSDTLIGGDGDDFLLGNNGAVLQSSVSEFIFGGAGNDFMRGGTADDVLDGGAGFDRLSYFSLGAGFGVTINLNFQGVAQNTGAGGWDTITSIEDVSGTEYADALVGSSADENLHGGGGDDTIHAGAGNDQLRGDGLAVLGNDVLDGGDGIDTVDYGFDIRTEGVLVDLAGQSGGSMSGPRQTRYLA